MDVRQDGNPLRWMENLLNPSGGRVQFKCDGTR